MAEGTLLDLSFTELKERIDSLSLPPYRAAQIWHAVYRELLPSYDEMTTLPRRLRSALSEAIPLPAVDGISTAASEDALTRKRLFRLHDGETIETVEMVYPDRGTICISTQVGCSIGCPFCATGKGGFVRDLTCGEIVAQVLTGARSLKEEGRRLTNVVYMGMGEPFLNYERTMKSIRILNDKGGFGLGARGFTVSTAGIVPGIERFSAEGIQANLAVSLHAGNDELRDRLVPINRRYPLAELIEVCSGYIERTHRRITFEIALIDGVNDSIASAREVASLIRGLLAHVNLIPLNPIPDSPLKRSSDRRVRNFAKALEEAGIPVTIRDSRGVEIQAGCGQLRRRINRATGRDRTRGPAPPTLR